MMSYLAIALAVSVGFNLLLFLVAFRRQTDKLTDISYALTFIALALYGFVSHTHHGVGSVVLAAMIVAWALRLGGFLLMRIWHTGSDARFDEMRNNFGKFGKFWLLQGVSVWVILLAALEAFQHTNMHLTWLSWLGVIIWLKGVIIESLADVQKYRFSQVAANKGRWIHTGIWRWSRHPNYFGEILTWVGVYVFVVQSLPLSETLIALLSPLYIATLLLFVSGVPILERGADKRWGNEPEYQDYKRHTSLIIPWPPRR